MGQGLCVDQTCAFLSGWMSLRATLKCPSCVFNCSWRLSVEDLAAIKHVAEAELHAARCRSSCSRQMMRDLLVDTMPSCTTQIYLDKAGNVMLRVSWLYRPKEVVARGAKLRPEEVMYSRWDAQPRCLFRQCVLC